MSLPSPYWQSPDGRHVIYCADCLLVLPHLTGVDAVVTDTLTNQREGTSTMKAKAKKQPLVLSDAVVMLQVFHGCILTRITPSVNSPCHKRIKQIIRKHGGRVAR